MREAEKRWSYTQEKYIAGSRCSRKPQMHLGEQQYWVSEFDETGEETGGKFFKTLEQAKVYMKKIAVRSPRGGPPEYFCRDLPDCF